VSIRYGWQAFNLTCTEPVVAGLQAVVLGTRAVDAGRSDAVLAAATEDEAPRPAANLLGLTGVQAGACTLLLERLDQALARRVVPYAVAGSAFLARAEGDQVWERFRGWLAGAVEECSAAGGGPVPCCVTAALGPEGDFRLWRALGEMTPPLNLLPAFGPKPSYLSVSPVLQVAHLAATHGRGVVVAGGPDGHVAGLSLRAPPEGGRALAWPQRVDP
jgi:hypothetical protein